MAELTTVARPYAEAVFRAASEAGAIERYGKALAQLGVAVQDVSLVSMLSNPRVSAAEKAGVLGAISGEASLAPLANLTATLIENGKSVLFASISEQFQNLKRKHDGVVKATIISAFAMSDSERAALVDALAGKYGKKIEADVIVDESLIGGARVQVGDEVVHASVRDMLDKMKQSLAA